MSLAFKSGSFSSAILRTWAPVTLPTFWRFEVGLPFSIPASFFRSTAAGGVLVMNVNVRSLKIVTSTGVIIPCACAVLALNCFTNSMMFTPCGPRAVPTGGAGVACPAGTWSFTTAIIGLAMSPCASARLCGCASSRSVSLQLEVVELHRRRPAEQGHRDAHLALVRNHLFDRARKVRERPLGDLHDLSHQERNLLLRLLFLNGFLDPEEAVDLLRPERDGGPARPPCLDHLLTPAVCRRRVLI